MVTLATVITDVDDGLVHAATSVAVRESGLGAVAVVVVVVCLLAVIGVATPFIIVHRRRRIVWSTSHALRGLLELNGRYGETVWPLPAIAMAFSASTTSKSQFDRFDLRRHHPRTESSRTASRRLWARVPDPDSVAESDEGDTDGAVG